MHLIFKHGSQITCSKFAQSTEIRLNINSCAEDNRYLEKKIDKEFSSAYALHLVVRLWRKNCEISVRLLIAFCANVCFVWSNR